MENIEKCTCTECKKREEAAKAYDETSLAVLIALIPMLTLTMFSNLGLF